MTEPDTHADIDAILGVQASPQSEARNKAIQIPTVSQNRLTRTPTRRLFVDASRVKAAIEVLRGLPATGESWHCLMGGDFDSFDLVDAVLAHAHPASIDALHMATLGFNHANASRLVELMDNGRIRHCTMVVSLYYEADQKEAETCYTLATELPRRGGWYLATRSHAKVIAARLTDGRCFTIESSANLRSCRNLEQFCITQDAALFEFHRRWMHEAYEQRARTSRDR